jgi:positive regulator of sigma E activity
VLLDSVVGVATMLGSAYLADLDTTVSLICGAVAGLAAGFLLVRAFRSRSGGRSVKLR